MLLFLHNWTSSVFLVDLLLFKSRMITMQELINRIRLKMHFIANLIEFLIMGAPKKKWTAEEEAALDAGVKKHGTGRWQMILRDPEFSNLLCSRSNVDIKVCSGISTCTSYFFLVK